jgi:hypothetical protein
MTKRERRKAQEAQPPAETQETQDAGGQSDAVSESVVAEQPAEETEAQQAEAQAAVSHETPPSEGSAPQGSAPEPEATSESYVEEDQQIAAGHNSKNAIMRDRAKAFTKVGALGRENGQGKKSLVALVELVVSLSSEGVLVPDDATKIYQKFRDEAAKSAGRYAAPEQSADSLKANASKLKQIMECGAKIMDVADVFSLARDMHIQALGNDDKARLKSKGTYEALVNVAREQLKDHHKGIALTEDEILEVLFNEESERKPKTALDFVKDGLVACEKARAGKKAKGDDPGRAPLDHGNLDGAIAHLLQCLAELDPEFTAKRDAEMARASDSTQQELPLQAA